MRLIRLEFAGRLRTLRALEKVLSVARIDYTKRIRKTTGKHVRRKHRFATVTAVGIERLTAQEAAKMPRRAVVTRVRVSRSRAGELEVQ